MSKESELVQTLIDYYQSKKPGDTNLAAHLRRGDLARTMQKHGALEPVFATTERVAHQVMKGYH